MVQTPRQVDGDPSLGNWSQGKEGDSSTSTGGFRWKYFKEPGVLSTSLTSLQDRKWTRCSSKFKERDFLPWIDVEDQAPCSGAYGNLLAEFGSPQSKEARKDLGSNQDDHTGKLCLVGADLHALCSVCIIIFLFQWRQAIHSYDRILDPDCCPWQPGHVYNLCRSSSEGWLYAPRQSRGYLHGRHLSFRNTRIHSHRLWDPNWSASCKLHLQGVLWCPAPEVLYTFSILVNILLDAALTGSIAYRTAAAQLSHVHGLSLNCRSPKNVFTTCLLGCPARTDLWRNSHFRLDPRSSNLREFRNSVPWRKIRRREFARFILAAFEACEQTD